MSRKTEEIKFRAEPLKKLALEQIAYEQDLVLSTIVRQAIAEFLDKHSDKRQPADHVST